MVRLLIVLFWISLIVGTYVTGNVLGNWVVCLLALFFFIRSRRRRANRGGAGSVDGTIGECHSAFRLSEDRPYENINSVDRGWKPRAAELCRIIIGKGSQEAR